ncbi:Flp pilus assembly protein, ATPase CpaE [Actinomyces bovis]|uniref:Flp pilus assembly protein, ATPase CpaE n=1 Tax=Actinomyces bovis TaxID=1658 RepID=A0ABY1VMZ9_9ACTO|nr:ParA family protein [Actinomyces bovis]SPT53478.1 Flp pilus assembly protein, ATPase CpaE [Actinomyces bovis]VEG55357.1 Flp pilus assembly protein, ATPase CpaE [Actinomyces israelii]
MTTTAPTTTHTAHVEIHETGAASVTINDTVYPLRAANTEDARKEAKELIIDYAQSFNCLMLTTATEPSGSWTICIHPDGSVTTPPPHHPTTAAPPRNSGHHARMSAPTPPDQLTDPAPAPSQPVHPTTMAPPVASPPAKRAATTHAPTTAQPLPQQVQDIDARQHARSTSMLTEATTELPAKTGWRGALNLLGLHLSPSPTERAERQDIEAVAQHWAGPRTIAIVNGKGGSGKTPATVLLSATFARNGGAGVIAWDNNPTRGTLGWRTLQGSHNSSVEDLLPHVEHLLSPAAQAAELAAFVHHQPGDRFDVLRSRPELLAEAQSVGPQAFNSVHDVLRKYYRLVLIDSGNDESAPAWRAMINKADAIVVPTTTRPEHAESARLLLDELAHTDTHCTHLAANALVIVSQASKAEPGPNELVATFNNIARAAIGIPYDPMMSGRPLLLGSLAPSTQRAWLQAGAALAAGLR